MANIEQELLAFKNAKKGEDVRDSMISAIRKINTVNEEGVEEIEQKSDQMVEIVDSQIQIDEEPTQYTKLKLETTGTDIEVLTAEELNEALKDTDIQAEMEDIRVPASGFEPQTPYTSAGQAVRGQVRTLNAKIGDLKNAFNNVIGVPVLSDAQWVEGAYINVNTGSFDAYGGWHRSQYIDIGNNEGKTIHFTNTKGVGSSYNLFYDANHNKVGSNFDTNNTDIVVPTGARFFAVSIESNYDVSWKWDITTLLECVTQEELNTVVQDYNTNKLIFSIVKNSYVNRSDGSFISYTGWDRTDYIDVSNYESVTVKANGKTLYNSFYDSTKAFIKTFGIFNGNNVVPIPQNAVYMVLSGDDDIIDTIAVIKPKKNIDSSYMQDECLILRNNLPSYYTDYPTNPNSYNDGAYIDTKADEVSLANKNFIFITDVHWQSNAQNSNKLIAYLRKKLHIKNVVHGGDILDYDRDNPYLASVHMREWVDEARSACGSGLLPVHGNHDVNTGSGRGDDKTEADIMPYAVAESIQLDGSKPYIVQETDEQIASRIASITFDSDADRQDVIAYYKLHYYCDDDKNKIRYIVLNHGTHLNGVIYQYFNVRQFGEVFMQMDWLYETLMSTPNNYTVVVAMHAFINWANNKVESGPLQVCNMLSGFRTKNASCRVTNTNNIPNYAYGYHYYDFTNAPTPKGVLCIGGDMHWDHAVVCRRRDGVYDSVTYTDAEAMHDDSIVVVHTQTDAYGRTYPSGTYVGDTYPMTQGTVTEQCFDVVSMSDQDTYIEAKFVRVGAGVDRVFKLSTAN